MGGPWSTSPVDRRNACNGVGVGSALPGAGAGPGSSPRQALAWASAKTPLTPVPPRVLRSQFPDPLPGPKNWDKQQTPRQASLVQEKRLVFISLPFRFYSDALPATAHAREVLASRGYGLHWSWRGVRGPWVLALQGLPRPLGGSLHLPPLAGARASPCSQPLKAPGG